MWGSDGIEEADSIEAALEKLLEKKIDLVFLDIHLTEESGLSLADKINRMPNPPFIIFATAYDEYVVQAFERDSRDYLLKPFELDRVQKAVKRANEALNKKTSADEKSTDASEVYPVKTEDRIFMVKADEIQVLEVNQGETTLFTAENNYRTDEPLVAWEKRLPTPPFMRVHRSFLVHLDKIVEIQPWFNQTYQLTTENKLKVTVSRSNVQEFKKQMGLAD